jgi:DNA ligase (NAD+)
MEKHIDLICNTSAIEWGETKTPKEIMEVLKYLSDKYYNSDDALVDDWVFDSLVDIYNNKSDIPYKYIGAKIDDKNKIKLPCHMGSMDKTKPLIGLDKWLNKQPLDVSEFVISPKIDGTSALITYDTTKDETNVYTRGDGTEGKLINFLGDVFLTDSIKENLKAHIEGNSTFICRGEMIVSNENFQKFSEIFKSPRSMVNGLTNKKSENKEHVSSLEFKLFEIIEPKLSTYDQFILANKLGFNVVDFKKVSRGNLISDLSLELKNTMICNVLNEYRASYNYEIDGIIISSNRVYSLPETGNPVYSIAFKINQAGKQTTITEIQWNVSKHGLLIPTIVFEQITLGKSSVTKCSGFNGAFIFKNSLGPGAEIRVVLSGEVIPYICEIVNEASVPKMPMVEYKWNETRVQCEIVGDTPELAIQRIVNFIKTIKIDYLAEGMVKHLYLNGFTSLKMILQIKREQLLKLDRIEDKMANKIIKSIDDKIGSPLELNKIMDGSLSFGHGFGEKRCKQIISNFPTFLDKSPEIEEIKELPGWSDKSANKFLDGLSIFKEFIMENSYLKIKNIKNIKNINQDGEGKNDSNINLSKVCITGKRDPSIVVFLEKNGVEISSSITNDIDMLICEDINSGSGKIKQATNKSKPIMESNDFIKKYKI